MSKKVKKILFFAGGALAVGIVFIVLFWSKISAYRAGSQTTINAQTARFKIEQFSSAEDLANALQREGIIDSKEDFLTVFSYKKLGKDQVALGMYSIKPNTSYRDLINGFIKNKRGNGNAEVEVTVTFNNCRTLKDLAKALSKCTGLKEDSLLDFLSEESTRKKYGFTLEQWPAVFMPNTYKMYYDTDAETFVARMVKEYQNFWTQDRKQKLIKQGLKEPSEAVTLASIVYSEQSKHAEEWPTIAGLYLNRLRTGMKLQSDPTFKFCWGDSLDGVERLTAVHRAKDCAYNTYKIQGLPPGPIYLPPSSVVDAVLNAPKVDYLYMCAKPDYSSLHNFAVDGDEHLRNAKVFQDWLTIEQTKKKKNP